ncbi:MAG TPA: DbpA RNA binding domain-containing protein, partial [Acidimicrobiales bacterium]|nr:DbpA RNA binding domain-containing protein [Acidimicrobiales bacterium]
RDRVMGRLRGGSIEVLVATDVAARGLDVDTLTHVINYDVPSNPDAYVHRIGRVGRGGRTGTAITLADPREHRQLRNIERETKQKIEVEAVPTVADLRNRRLESTLASMREVLAAPDDLDHFQVVIDTLTVDHDIVDVALAAVRLAHDATSGTDDDEEIPEATVPRERPVARAGAKPRGGAARPTGPMTRLYVSSGRHQGMRPQDLVGAITGETRLSGRDIGAIEIADRFSLVEVPDDAVDEVLHALNRSTIKGKRTTVRRERFTPSPRGERRPR